MKLQIQPASFDDAKRILDIYKPHVEGDAISFEWETPSLKEIERRILLSRTKHIWLVCRSDDEVVGFAYASEFRKRKAYDWVTEVSVYVDPAFGRQSIAYTLYTTLEDILRAQGYRQMIAVMTSPNPASRAFHLKYGFKSVGVMPSVGYKFDQWHSIEILIKRLKSATEDIRPIQQLDDADIANLCKQGSKAKGK